jgi:hypothetical protein
MMQPIQPPLRRPSSTPTRAYVPRRQRPARLTRAVVMATHYTDENEGGELPSRAYHHPGAVTVDLMFLGGGRAQDVPVTQRGSSVTNLDLWVPHAATRTLDGTPFAWPPTATSPPLDPENVDGEWVLVDFIDGDPMAPVVIGSTTHPRTRRPQEGATPKPLPSYTPGEAENLSRLPDGLERFGAHQGAVVRLDRAGNLRIDLGGAGVADDGETQATESAAVAAAGAAAALAAGVAAGAAAGARAGRTGGNATTTARAVARKAARKAARAAKFVAEVAEAAGQVVELAENAVDLAAAAALAVAEEEAAALAQLVTDAAEARARDLLAAEYEGGAGAGAALGAAAGAAVAAVVAGETTGHGVGWIDVNMKPGAAVIIRSGGVPVFVLTAEGDGQVVLDVGRNPGQRAVLGDRLMRIFDSHRHLDAFGVTGPVVPADRMSTAQGNANKAALSERVHLPTPDED